VDDGGDVVFLEEADGGDASGTGFEAGLRIPYGYAAQCENWDRGMAGLAEGYEAGGSGCGRVFFFEDRGEDGEGGCVCGGFVHFFRGVTRDCDQWIFG
jgi:hypothetical protein